LDLRAARSEVRRSIGERVRDGEAVLRNFPDFSTESIAELAANIPALLSEFVASARQFEFDQPNSP
jgi:hypothetical protein